MFQAGLGACLNSGFKMTVQIPAIQLHQAPAVEPVTVAEVKTYLRIDGESEDGLISSMISAARIAAEKYMKVSIISQKWKLSFDEICPQEIRLPYGPVVAIDSVKTIDSEATETTFDSDNYYLTSGNLSIYFREIPSGQRVEIIYSTGFGAAADNVPELIKQGIMAHVALMFERKLAVAEVSETAKSLYNVYRNITI